LPYLTSDEGKVHSLNQSYFVQRFCHEHLFLFELGEGWFFVYQDESGAWFKVLPDVIKKMFRLYWEHLKTNIFREQQLAHRNTNSFENAIVDGSRSFSGRKEVFKRLEKIIHCKNGMLHIDSAGNGELRAFSPDYYSRNAVPVNWNPEAKAPKFEGILATMNPDDASLLLRYCGNILLGGNPSQQILLLVGEGGTSKSTICEIIELLLGRHNVAELRTKFLHERFEIGRYIGNMLLSGKDVKGDFLMTEGASALKKLTGHDNMTGEIKFSMATPEVYGDFPALITCNERLLVRLEGDIDVTAWARRLMMIAFGSKSKHQQVIANYAQKLVEEEGEGNSADVYRRRNSPLARARGDRDVPAVSRPKGARRRSPGRKPIDSTLRPRARLQESGQRWPLDRGAHHGIRRILRGARLDVPRA
jgi:hypothetical protein